MDNDSLPLTGGLKDPALLLWAAGAVAAIFVGFLVFDYFKRRRHTSRFARPRSIRDKVKTSLAGIKEAKSVLERRAQQQLEEQERATRAARHRNKV